jgi:hypothetical protein
MIDQLPDVKSPVDETLDGGIGIHIEKLSQPVETRPDGHILAEITKNRPIGRLIVISPIRTEHFDFNVSELQSLFLKALRPIVSSNSKFFGEMFSKEVINVVALRWEPPDIFFNPKIISYIQERIGKLYAEVELQLKVIIFTDPEMPWELLRKYK